jgi:hypothetical protein
LDDFDDVPDAKSPCRRVERAARAGHPPTDDQHIERLVGHAAQRLPAIEQNHVAIEVEPALPEIPP